MKENMDPQDVKLSTLLHESRVSPALPPRFRENVWRRIEDAEAPVASAPGLSWLDALAALVLRPRFALATAVVLVAAGALLGVRAGDLAANQTAQAQYLTAVAPPAMR
jgi:ferric-dicitrate binding protein FerR (iron transport regulator)